MIAETEIISFQTLISLDRTSLCGFGSKKFNSLYDLYTCDLSSLVIWKLPYFGNLFYFATNPITLHPSQYDQLTAAL